jgi:hypothetical protein
LDIDALIASKKFQIKKCIRTDQAPVSAGLLGTLATSLFSALGFWRGGAGS